MRVPSKAQQSKRLRAAGAPQSETLSLLLTASACVRLRARVVDLRRALYGRVRTSHRLLLCHLLAHVEFLEALWRVTLSMGRLLIYAIYTIYAIYAGARCVSGAATSRSAKVILYGSLASVNRFSAYLFCKRRLPSERSAPSGAT